MNGSKFQMTESAEIDRKNEEDCCLTYTWIFISLERARVPLRQQQADDMKDQETHKPTNARIPDKCIRVADSRHCRYFTTISKRTMH